MRERDATAILDGLSPQALDVCELLWFEAYNIVLAEIADELAARGLVKIGKVKLTRNKRAYCGVIRTFLPMGVPAVRQDLRHPTCHLDRETDHE